MTKIHLADTATVMTGESSLRNFAYEPSKQGSADESSIHSDDDEDGASALSSIRSSVKRGLRQQKSKGFVTSSTQSVSTRQSEGMWQDNETEVELYDTDEEEELQQRQQQRQEIDQEKTQSTSSRKVEDLYLDSELENLNSEDEQVGGLNGSCSDRKAPSLVASKDSKESKASKNFAKRKGTKEEKGDKQIPPSSKPLKRSEPTKKLRFSKESLNVVVDSRDGKRTSRRKTPLPIVLNHVEYYTAYDDASTNQDLSTIHPLGMEECEEIFKERIPFEVPAHLSTDEMSSIHALSTRVPFEKPVQRTENKMEEAEAYEEMSVAITIPEVDAQAELDTEDGTTLAGGRPTWVQLVFADRSDSEIFLVTLVGVSFVTLVVLILIMIAL